MALQAKTQTLKQEAQTARLTQESGSDWIGKHQSLHEKHAELEEQAATRKSRLEEAAQLAQDNMAKLGMVKKEQLDSETHAQAIRHEQARLRSELAQISDLNDKQEKLYLTKITKF